MQMYRYSIVMLTDMYYKFQKFQLHGIIFYSIFSSQKCVMWPFVTTSPFLARKLGKEDEKNGSSVGEGGGVDVQIPPDSVPHG